MDIVDRIDALLANTLPSEVEEFEVCRCLRDAKGEIERLKKDSMPEGFVKWLTITRGPTGRLHAHWPYAGSKGCLVTRELMDQMLCDAGAKPRWIPVSERLPDNDQPVLAWNSGGYCQKPWAWWQICDYEDGKWREQDERDEYPGVTHWMPLPPEPPNWKPLFEPPTE